MANHARSAQRTRPSSERHAPAAPSSAARPVGLRDARAYRSPESCRSCPPPLGPPAIRAGAGLRPAIEIEPIKVWQGADPGSPLGGMPCPITEASAWSGIRQKAGLAAPVLD